MSAEFELSGIAELAGIDIEAFVSGGGRLVRYEYCISSIVFTFRRASRIHFLPPGSKGRARGLAYALFSFLFGWWGIPWGMIYTAQVIRSDLRGGHDVTAEFLARLPQAPVPEN
jgi:hypothetical protein